MPDSIRHFQIFAYSAIFLSVASSIIDAILFPNIPALRAPIGLGMAALFAVLQLGWVWLIANRKINLVRWSWIVFMTLGTFLSFQSVRTSELPVFWPTLVLSYVAYLASANVLVRRSVAVWYRESAEREAL